MNLNVFQLKIDCYRYTETYITLVIAANQKTSKDIQRTKRKEPKQNANRKYQTSREEIKSNERTIKTIKKIIDNMAISTYVSITALNVNG